MSNEQSLTSFVKTTLLSGTFFLIPLLIVFYVIGRLKSLMIDIAAVIYPDQTIENLSGVFLINLFAICAFLLLAFVAGLIVRQSIFKRLRYTLGDFVSKMFPAYDFIKAYTEDLVAVDKSSSNFIPVLVDLGSNSRLGFQVDEFANGRVAVYLPGTPNPWSGSVCYVDSEKCTRLNVSFHDAIVYCRTPGNSYSRLAQLLRKANE